MTHKSTKNLPDPWVHQGPACPMGPLRTCLPHRSSAVRVGTMGGAGEPVLFGGPVSAVCCRMGQGTPRSLLGTGPGSPRLGLSP